MKKSRFSGFTLVELSVVIVIIALLTAGVISGQKIAQNAKLQNVIKELKEFETAANSFKDKFKYYPGDFPSAETYWPGSSPAAVSGNGNWQIVGGSTETLQFWTQLNLAGLLPGKYTGAVSGVYETPGVNCPKSVVQNGAYDAMYGTAFLTSGNFIEFGSLNSSPNGMMNGAILKPAEAYYIDTKIDDGFAASGILYAHQGAAYFGNTAKCVNGLGNINSTASYVLSDTTSSCRIWFWLDKNK